MNTAEVVSVGVLVSLVTLGLLIAREVLVSSGRRVPVLDRALILLILTFFMVAAVRLQELVATA